MDLDTVGGCSATFLSLTGYLSLQERKDKKGRLVAKRGGSHKYWFWFDEKDCVLKYYKNKDSYRQYLHDPLGSINMENAKVTPSAVHGDTDAKTFIISTKNGSYFGLTSESEDICHQWIKKLQYKRSEWIKRDRTKPQSVNYGGIRGGLVNEAVNSEASMNMSTTSSPMRIFFYENLGRKPPQDYQDPFEKCVGKGNRASTMPGHGSVSVSYDMVDGKANLNQESVDSMESSKSSDGNPDNVLTEHEKLILELKCELGDTRLEKDRLQKQVIKLENELARKGEENKKLFDELDKANELVHKINLPQEQFILENSNLKNINENLQKSLMSLNGEVELHKTYLEEKNKQITTFRERVVELEKELMSFKAKYVMLLSDSFKIPTPSPAGLALEDSDPIEEKMKNELINLIREETTPDNPLSDITTTRFEDHYGELHDWKGDSNICHFLCRHLYLHFTELEQESLCNQWYKYVNTLKKIKDRYYEIPTDRTRRKEFRGYLHRGIPHQFRSQVWSSMINHHVSKLKEVKDSAASGGNYYQSLLSITSSSQKQIHLDLYRTLPNNRHFKQNGSGAEKLQRVLLAYSNHNKDIGYCQGMNMIAAVGLLYLDEETTFWYLIATIEKLMPMYYYSHGLAAAQADQVVMKELVQEKLSALHEHLELQCADISIVTFNWFLTFFIDALPTESMLRVMDCFLFEGRKFFFRFSLAIFKQYERSMLSINDPVTLFQFIKEVGRHIFNVEELMKLAFGGFDRFPTRGQLNSRCQPHVEKFKNEWHERERQKEVSRASKQPLPSVVNQNSLRAKIRKQLQWECACLVNEEEVWLCCGERQVGRICIVTSSKEGFNTTSPQLNIGSKILCIKALSGNIVMIGTLDFSLHAICSVTKKELWSMKMNDSILDFVGVEDNILCALADGYIAVLRTNGELPPSADPVHYRIGNTAVQCMVHTPYNHIWCGCGKAITVICAKTHEPIKPIVMSDNCSRVYKMEIGEHGVWVTFRSSTIVCLFDAEHMIKLIEVDYPKLLGSDITSDPSFSKTDYRVVVTTPINNQLWIGTGNASIFIFSINSAVRSPMESISAIAAEQYRETTSRFEWSMQNRPQSDECLVSANADGTLSPVRVTENLVPGRRKFGKTFRHQLKREVSNDVKRFMIYELSLLMSSRVLPESQECSRVTILKPIKRGEQLFVISCVNSISAVEKAVQLWQCSSSKSPANWNYTCIPECYDCIAKEVTTPMQYDRRRAYSTIFGALPKVPQEVSPAVSSAEM